MQIGCIQRGVGRGASGERRETRRDGAKLRAGGKSRTERERERERESERERERERM